MEFFKSKLKNKDEIDIKGLNFVDEEINECNLPNNQLSQDSSNIIQKVGEYYGYTQEKIEALKIQVSYDPLSEMPKYKRIYNEHILKILDSDIKSALSQIKNLKLKNPDYYIFLTKKEGVLKMQKIEKKNNEIFEIYDGNYVEDVHFLDSPFKEPKVTLKKQKCI